MPLDRAWASSEMESDLQSSAANSGMMKTPNTELQKVLQEGRRTLKKRFHPLKDSTACLGCGFGVFVCLLEVFGYFFPPVIFLYLLGLVLWLSINHLL